MKRIARSFIDELNNRADVVAVVNARVPLKRSGANMMACCPFHEEKTPSFSVSPQKQLYKCFGCGASGGALNFLMDYEHLDFVAAVEKLPKKLGLKLNTSRLMLKKRKFVKIYTRFLIMPAKSFTKT